uniref:Uncharacterized protein n=1 Tax=Oryza punctata TaxID=4537 RepID=A0A0E0MCY8_ORYPU
MPTLWRLPAPPLRVSFCLVTPPVVSPYATTSLALACQDNAGATALLLQTMKQPTMATRLAAGCTLSLDY